MDPTPGSPPNPPSHVPDDLLRRLHEADDRLHEARQRLEKTMDGSDFRHEERVNQQMKEFRRAEKELEEVSREIQEKIEES